MKVMVAMDSMKGSLTSREAGNAAREGILRAIPDAAVTVPPVEARRERRLRPPVGCSAGASAAAASAETVR